MALTGLLGTPDSQPGALSPGVAPPPTVVSGAATAVAASALTATGVVVIHGTAVLSAGSSVQAKGALLRRYDLGIILRDASGLLGAVPSGVLR